MTYRASPNQIAGLLTLVVTSSVPITVIRGCEVFGRIAAMEGNQRQLEMIQVNVTSLVNLTRLLLPGIISRNTGGVLNVASIAAFQAGPNMAIYYATKAFVLSYTEALHEEVAATKLRITCLCPGPTNTGFVAAAGMEGVTLFKFGAQSSEDVAKVGFAAFQKNQAIAISGIKNKILALLGKFSPRYVTRKIAQALNQ